jgi:hypothetical protein
MPKTANQNASSHGHMVMPSKADVMFPEHVADVNAGDFTG